ncbi:MAG: radical SAM family heme chaperone HemW [Muribaculaceae bacterium]|nr:radical SAM family heme chaperone HemW [Muribaculaceae bacterium]
MAGLYIHIPYCRSKCAYCDFYSSPCSETADAYIDALISELRLRKSEIAGEPVKTIYIGGGTPSSLSHQQFAKLMRGIWEEIDTSEVVESTIEVNPDDVTPEFLNHVKSLGVNRVSMGVQSLNDAELKAVGRRHSADGALSAIKDVASAFDNFSLDIIFGLPGQTIATLSDTLDQIIAFQPSHLSAYLLSYEPGTRLYAALMASKIKEVSDSEAEGMYRLVTDRLRSAGYEHYEISNYARPGLRSRHNSSYWSMTPYLGLGSSAHSFDGKIRRYNPSSIKSYIEVINSGKCCYIIDDEAEWQQFNDLILVSMRTSEGLSLSRLDSMPRHYVDDFTAQLRPLLSQGAVIMENGSIKIPERNWLTSDAIIRELILSY